jgi:hypothetical protein
VDKLRDEHAVSRDNRYPSNDGIFYSLQETSYADLRARNDLGLGLSYHRCLNDKVKYVLIDKNVSANRLVHSAVPEFKLEVIQEVNDAVNQDWGALRQ